MRRVPAPALAAALALALVAAGALVAVAQQRDALGLARELGRGADDVDFRHLTVEQGLPTAAVAAVAQDALGFVWVGTLDGLVRWDGAELREFRHAADDAASPPSNVVSALAPAPGGDLWVGTAAGLARYRARTERFERVPGLPSDDVLAVEPDGAGGAWVGTAGGLAHVGAGGDVDGTIGTAAGLPDASVEALWLSRAGGLWIGTGDGLALRDAETGRLRTFRPAGVDGFPVSAVTPSDRGGLLVGTLGKGLFLFRPQSGRFQPVDVGPGVVADVVSSVHEDAEGTVWVGTLGGGLRRLVPGEDPAVYVSVADDPGSLAGDQVTGLMEDRQGVLWVATYDGLDRFDRARGTAVRLRHDPDDAESLASDEVLSVLHARDGTLYVGTDVSLDRSGDGRRFARTTVGAAGTQRRRGVLALYEDREGAVWAGTDGGGLYRVTPDGAENAAGPIGESGLTVTSLLEDRSGRFWIGTLGDGLGLYDRQSGGVTFYRSDPSRPGSLADDRVHAVAQATGGEIWVGTGAGLCRLDRPAGAGEFSCLRAGEEAGALADGSVEALHARDDGALYVGTRGGLHRLDTDDPEAGLTRYTTENSDLPGDRVLGIVEDEGGFLWLATDGGLVRFEPVTETFSWRPGSRTGAERTLTGAVARGPDGALSFGSTSGLLSFDPRQLAARNANPPEVVVTGVDVAGQPAVPGGGVLDVAAPVADAVELGPGLDYLTIHYAGLHFSDPAANTFRVRLDGLDDDWREVGGRREATYSTLGPGDYTFRVQAANADGVWSDEGAVLRVVVRPPWWRTWWALLGFAALAAVAAAQFDRWNRARLLRAERERAERRETELRAETAEAEQRKAEAEAAALKAENSRKAAELERAREVEEANAKLEAANGRLEASLRDLRETQAQLVQSEKLASLGQLTAGIAHEIKNPLNFVNNFADLSVDLADEVGQELAEAGDRPASALLDELGPLLDDLRENARRIHEHGQRADRIVRAMLLHSRGGAGERGRVDLNRFVDEYANLAYHGARANDADFHVALERDLGADVGEVEIVPQELGRVLINLITNAFHAVHERAAAGHGYAPAVTLRTRRRGGRVVLEVEDNGTGIPAATRERIFEPFFTTKPTGEGTGLGLSLAYDIVTQVHGGQMSVESVEGEGTTFTVVLPDAPPSDGGDAHPPALAAGRAGRG
jgi:signal transduction histidine kinase/ligand-binding sensor domain-containing protein